MKASEMIRQLTALKERHGDLEVHQSKDGLVYFGTDELAFFSGKSGQHTELEKPAFVWTRW